MNCHSLFLRTSEKELILLFFLFGNIYIYSCTFVDSKNFLNFWNRMYNIQKNLKNTNKILFFYMYILFRIMASEKQDLLPNGENSFKNKLTEILCLFIYVFISLCVQSQFIYTYMYTKREKERIHFYLIIKVDRWLVYIK